MHMTLMRPRMKSRDLAASGYIVSYGPSSFLPGQKKIVTVRVQNTGPAGNFLILHPSAPSGWTVVALKDKNILGDCNPYIAANAPYDATFDVTPPSYTSSGTITWEFREDGYLSNPLLDTEYQPVSAADTTPPTNPNSFIATPTVNTWSTDNTVNVSWSGASDNVGLKRYYYAWNTNSNYSVTTSDSFTDTTSGSGSKTVPHLPIARHGTSTSVIRTPLIFLLHRRHVLVLSKSIVLRLDWQLIYPHQTAGQSPRFSPRFNGARPVTAPVVASRSITSKSSKTGGLYIDKVDKDVTGTSYTLGSSEGLQWEKNYTWRLYAVDALSQAGNYTTQWNFTTHDNVAPSTPGTPDMDSGSDSGQYTTDNITNDNTPDILVGCFHR